MLEFYQAYATYEDLMDLTEEMLSGAAERVCGSTRVTYQGKVLDFGNFVDAPMPPAFTAFTPPRFQRPTR